jgi:hypothetical protein
MRWFRARQGWWWLAVLMLASQLVLSAGHRHFETAGSVQAFIPDDAAPSGDEAPGDAPDDCAVCRAIAAGGLSILPHTAEIAVPELALSVAGKHRANPGVARRGSAAFEARGPPQAA